MGYRALDDVLCGHAGTIPAGEIVPDTYIDAVGAEQTVDFDRLLALGIVQDEKLPWPPGGAPGEAAAPDGAPGELGKLKVDELKAIAAEENVELAADAKKADIVVAIEAARASA